MGLIWDDPEGKAARVQKPVRNSVANPGAYISALRTAHEHAAEQITRDARCGLDAAKTKLANTAERLRSEGAHVLASQGRTLLSLRVRLRDIAPAALERASLSTERARLLVDAHDPLAILKRGYSVTLDASGKPIKDATAVQPGGRIVTLLADGRISSTVDDVSPSVSHG